MPLAYKQAQTDERDCHDSKKNAELESRSRRPPRFVLRLEHRKYDGKGKDGEREQILKVKKHGVAWHNEKPANQPEGGQLAGFVTEPRRTRARSCGSTLAS
jgi:hypothetical protein